MMPTDTIHIFTPASHQDVLALILMIAVLLTTSRLLGELMLRLGQPSIIGEIGAGILLGPSILGYFFPSIIGYIIPATPTQGYLLETISLLGAMFLLLITGLEIDLNLIKHHAKTALSVSAGGIIVTFSTGFILGQMIPDALLPSPDQRLIFSLFMATAMSISAIPVIAKVLIDLNLIRRDIGQTIIAAGMSDDTCGWILLSIVTGLAAGHAVSATTVLTSVFTVVFFLAISFTIGSGLAKRALDFVQDNMKSPYQLLTLVVAFAFAWGSFSQALHFEPILGAFIVGIIFGHLPRLPRKIHQQLEEMTLGIFAPIFFAVAGLKVNVIGLLTRPDLLAVAFLVILIASVGKITGTYLGARFIGRQDHWTSLSFGAALNARGAMEIIIATIGLSLGILTQDMFSIIVLMAITTSLMAPFALRWTLRHVHPSEKEEKRMEKERLAEKSQIQNIHRVLIPIRKRVNDSKLTTIQIIKAGLLQKMADKMELSITLFSVDLPEHREANFKFLHEVGALFPGQEVVIKFVEGNPAEEIIEESKKGYDLLIMGASQRLSDEQYLFSDIIDSVVKFSACATLIIHTPNIASDWTPKRILVPTNGSVASRHAAELSFLFSSSQDQQIVFLHVVEAKSYPLSYRERESEHKNQMEIGKKIIDDLKALADMHHVSATTDIQTHLDAGAGIVQAAESHKVDLIILGTDIRPASHRLFFGPSVERILKTASCPVLVLNTVQ
ncbi:MAG TPA: cation:proton antiporter [Candidatus Omnitrophota bacterium]|nr:cation:proton antiporter [Candidatus Omnitrophota bacterium]